MIRCAILGASGHGKVIAEIAELNGYSEISFFDDSWPNIVGVEHWEVVGSTYDLLDDLNSFDSVFIAIGNNGIRLQKQELLFSKGAKFPVLIHPRATVSKYSQIGCGTVIMAGAVVNPFSKVGDSCIINTSASIDHDCMLGDGVHISPGVNLAGGVQVGCKTWVGIGANVKQYINIGNNVTIGAGAAVIRDVLDEQVVIGVPALPLIYKD